jgi:hypothetical protein
MIHPIVSPARDDSDARRVALILRGAWRSEGDPDLDLVAILGQARDADDATLRSVLVSLVKDANPD